MCYGVGKSRAPRLNHPDGNGLEPRTFWLWGTRANHWATCHQTLQHARERRIITTVFLISVCVFGSYMAVIFFILWRIDSSLSVPESSLSPVLETKCPHHLWVQQQQGALWSHDVPQEPTHQGVSSCRLSAKGEGVLVCEILICAFLIFLILQLGCMCS